MCVCVCMPAEARRGLELELLVVVSQLSWMLGAMLGSSERAVSILTSVPIVDF